MIIPIIPIIPIIFAQRVTGLEEDEEEAQMQVAWKASARWVCNHCHYPPCSFYCPYPPCSLQCPYLFAFLNCPSFLPFAMPILFLFVCSCSVFVLVTRALSLCPSSFSFPGLSSCHLQMKIQRSIYFSRGRGRGKPSILMAKEGVKDNLFGFSWQCNQIIFQRHLFWMFSVFLLFCCRFSWYHNSKWCSIKNKNQKNDTHETEKCQLSASQFWKYPILTGSNSNVVSWCCRI